MAAVIVRARAASDIDALERLARAVQVLDGYLPHPPRELRRFVASPGAIAAWVAEIDGTIVGHVALHADSSDEVMALASKASGTPAERIGVVARLFVDAARRRQGIADALLSTATTDAVARGLTPILDVATHFESAIALYEKHGWRRVGEVVVAFRDQDLREFVYVHEGVVAPADRARQ